MPPIIDGLSATADEPRIRPLPATTWIDLAIPVAAAWALLYATLGLFWALGGTGFPFGTANDPGAQVSILAGVDVAGAAPIIVVLGLAGALVALGMTRPIRRATPFHRALLVFAGVAAVALALVVPDYRLLATVGYAPIILIGAPFGWPEGVNLSTILPWPVVNQVLVLAGGLTWAAAGVAYQRRLRGACGRCGRGATAAGWTTAEAAARWGRGAVAVAVAVPVVYAVTRWAWALGIPLGISEEFLRELQTSGAWIAGAALATMGLGGALLTLGLTQRWGEVFPRWIPPLAGRRVPPALAIVPASGVSVVVAMAGVMFVRLQVSGTLGDLFGVAADEWATIGPELLWPLWGAALAAATLAYHYRRRGACQRCGRS